jgi:DnaJ domain
MLWLLLGTVVLTSFLFLLRAFERASVTSIRMLFLWILAIGGALLALLMVLSGRGLGALMGLAFVGPVLWRHWQQSQLSGGSRSQGGGPSQGSGGASQGPGPGSRHVPPRSRQGMSVEEAYEVLGLKPGSSETEIRAAHRRLMRAAHPDSGGSDWLAARINQARDALLR